jgi:hypothetical protein
MLVWVVMGLVRVTTLSVWVELMSVSVATMLV